MVINVSNNQLKSIAQLTHFPNIREIKADNNLIENMTIEKKDFKYLTLLEVPCNRLRAFPDIKWQLEYLEVLDVSRNQINLAGEDVLKKLNTEMMPNLISLKFDLQKQISDSSPLHFTSSMQLQDFYNKLRNFNNLQELRIDIENL